MMLGLLGNHRDVKQKSGQIQKNNMLFQILFLLGIHGRKYLTLAG